MSRKEFYNAIVGRELTITGGAWGLGFTYNGKVNNIIGDTIIIDDLTVVLSGEEVQIEQIENHFHININNTNEVYITLN